MFLVGPVQLHVPRQVALLPESHSTLCAKVGLQLIMHSLMLLQSVQLRERIVADRAVILVSQVGLFMAYEVRPAERNFTALFLCAPE